MSDVHITVTLDDNNVVHCKPDPATAQGLGTHTIIWTSGTPHVALESAEFVQRPGKPNWPGSKPAKQPKGELQSIDPVSGSDVLTFKYTITVSRNGQPFSVDPEVQNDPGHL